MAGANKRTSGMLILLALLFIITVIILCLIPDSGQPRYIQNPKNRPLAWDVLTNTPPPTTTTTTVTSTTKEGSTTTPTTQPPPPPTSDITSTATTPNPTPPPPPLTTTRDATATTTNSPTSPLTTTTTNAAATTNSSLPLTTDATATTTTTSPPLTSTTTTPVEIITVPTTTTQSTQLPDESTTTTEVSTESSSMSHPQSTQESTTTTSEPTTPTTDPYEGASNIPATTSESSTHSTDSSVTPTSTTSSMPTTCPQPAASESADVCMTPACKTLAARMLDLMDHSATKPCEDFYQYACGGVTDDLFLDPENSQKVTRHFILDELKDLSPKDPELGPLKVFYDSCTAAEVESRNRTFWLSRVKAALDTVGSTLGAWLAEDSVSADDSLISITEILIGMMKIHFSPFFDILLDVAEDGTDKIVLMLTPPMLPSPFSKDMGWAMCYSEHFNRTREALDSPSSSYNVNDDYEEYSECIGNGQGLYARLIRMTLAVKELGLMHYFNNTNHTQGADSQLVESKIETDFLLRDLYHVLPNKAKLRDAHLKKVFKNVTLSYVEKRFDFPNFKVEWVTLVEELLGHPVDPDSVIIHIYFEEDLHAALDEIDFRQDATKLRRIMMLLLAERLYTDLVEPEQQGLGKQEYCLMVTTELLGDFVSSLYLRSVSHLQERQQKMKEVIKSNKEAAEKELLHQPNLKPEELEMWLNKLKSMSGEMASPESSQYLLQDMNETNSLSDNFADNCLILLTRHRSLMYQHYQSSSSSPAVLWSYYLKPFSPSGISLYASNKFLIPFGAMEAPLFFWDVPDYINYAGIGHMTAHELLHGFDGTGIQYNGTQRQTLEGFNHFLQVSECLSDQYRAPQSLKADSGLRANFTLGRLPLNEILANSGAVRLAWEAYEHSLMSQQGKGKGKSTADTIPEPQQLPWLDHNPLQLYFLRTAQIHCTASSEIHMLPLMENEHLPSRLWVNLVLQNEPLFTEAFNCPAPVRQCPYILGSIPASSNP